LRLFLALLHALFVLTLLGQMLGAQTFTATLTGTAKDPSGSPVSGARIAIINTATNQRIEMISAADGNYTATQLQPGTYRVEVTAIGFKNLTRDGIVLQINQQAQLDLHLEVGDVGERVEVKGDVSLLETESSSVGTVVDNKLITNLPLNTRNVYSLVFLTPGVAGSVNNTYGGTSYSVNGVRPSLMDTLVDGVSAAIPTVNGFTGITVFPSIDAVQEFKILAQNFPAEYGRSLGSVMNIIFKSGTNQIHGAAFEFLRNSVLDANNFFSNRNGTDLSSFKRNQFGSMISGPIRSDKTFFLFNYEGLRERSYDTTLTSVPTQLQRSGDFSQTFAPNGQLIRIYDPFSLPPAGTPNAVRTQFPNNVIPANRIDPVAAKVISYYPLPNVPGNALTGANNYFQAGSHPLNIDQGDVRIDHNITEAQHLFGRYSRRFQEDAPAQLFPSNVAVAEGQSNNQNSVNAGVIGYTNSLSANTVLSATVGYSRVLFRFLNRSLGFEPSELGFPDTLNTAQDSQLFPAFNVSGYRSLGGNDNRRSSFQNWSMLASISHTTGRHTFKFGYEGRIIQSNTGEARPASFSFGTDFTQGPIPTVASSTSGNGIASLLLGAGTTGSVINNFKNVAATSWYEAGYVQDDWRITPRLTLNLGVRYDIDLPRTERYNRFNTFNPSVVSPLATVFPGLTGGLEFAGVNGNSRSQYDLEWRHLAPRIGVAYQVNQSTVIRAAYSHLYGPSTQQAQGTVGPYGFRSETPWQSSIDGVRPTNLLSNPFPFGTIPPTGSSLALLTQVGGPIEAPLRHTPTPYTIQWSFGIQRQLPANTLLLVSYVGNRGLQLSRGGEGGFNLNQLDPRYLSLGSELNDQVPNPFYTVNPVGILASPTVRRAQLLLPYPQFSTIRPLFSAGASSNYHALQVAFSKRLSYNVEFTGSYVWSKTIDEGQDYQNSYNIREARGLSSIDIPHRFVASVIYQFPFGKDRKFATSMNRYLEAVVGGWQVNGIVTLQSGAPISVTANNTSGLGADITRANNNGNSAKLSGDAVSRLNRWFDTSVFSQPAPFTLGNVRVLPDVRADTVKNLDLSLFKEFQIAERAQMQFRAESFNLFNHPVFSAPNGSVTSNTFGAVTSQSNVPRQIQFGLKFLW
jgi:Carboxypeptidase regulatory-like domain/TonB dependent receptor